MLQMISCPKLIWKILNNNALGRKGKSTDVKHLIVEDSNSENISRNKYIAQKLNNYFANTVTHMVFIFLIVLALRITYNQRQFR